MKDTKKEYGEVKADETEVKRKDKNWTVMEVEFIDEDKFPKNIYEVETPRQLQRWLDDLSLDVWNDTEKAVRRIVSMVERNKDESLIVAKEVNGYIMTTEGGWFSVDDIYKSLHLSTDAEGKRRLRKNIVTCLIREKDKGIIIPSPHRNGTYRRIMDESEVLNWADATMSPMDIIWPFGFEELVDIYPTNIIVLAGEKDKGKTTLLLNFILLNMGKHRIHYHTSEMAEQELKLRYSKFEEAEMAKIDEWKNPNLTCYLRTANFADAVVGKEDDIVIFDFLEIHDRFWNVGEIIKEIHARLKGGICIIALQKSKYKELGRGGDYALEKARLYLTMEWGKIKIISGKNWHGTRNPAGLVHEFKIVYGSKIIPQGVWHEEDSDPFEGRRKF